MKFDLFGALKILAVEFGSGRSIIEVEDLCTNYRVTVRVFFSGEMYASEFTVGKDSEDHKFFNELFQRSVAQVRQLYNVENLQQVKR